MIPVRAMVHAQRGHVWDNLASRLVNTSLRLCGDGAIGVGRKLHAVTLGDGAGRREAAGACDGGRAGRGEPDRV